MAPETELGTYGKNYKEVDFYLNIKKNFLVYNIRYTNSCFNLENSGFKRVVQPPYAASETVQISFTGVDEKLYHS